MSQANSYIFRPMKGVDVSASSYYMVELRDPNTGTVARYPNVFADLEILLGSGAFEYRILEAATSWENVDPSTTSNYSVLRTWSGFSLETIRIGDTAGQINPISYTLTKADGTVVDTQDNVIGITLPSDMQGAYKVTMTSAQAGARSLMIARTDGLDNAWVAIENQSGDSAHLYLSQALTQDTPFLVTVKSKNGIVNEAFYSYGNLMGLNLTDGASTITIYHSTQGTIELDFFSKDGEVRVFEGAAVSDNWAWVDEEIQEASGLANAGIAIHKISGSTADIYLSDSLSSQTPFYVTIKSSNGAVNEAYYVYGDLIRLNLVEGESTLTIHHPTQGKIELEFFNYGGELRAFEGAIISDDFAWVGEEIEKASGVDGAWVAIEDNGGGTATLLLSDELAGQTPFFVNVNSKDGKISEGYYSYGNKLNLNLVDGVSTVTIHHPTHGRIELDFYSEDGEVKSVERKAVVDNWSWLDEKVEFAVSISPVGTSETNTKFSFFSHGADGYIVQIKDPATQTIGTYYSEDGTLSVNLGEGKFVWRAFAAPSGVDIDAEAVEKFADIEGGWQEVNVVAEAPDIDYILGTEPDRITSIDQLHLNYPSQALLLDDGSTLITNTLGATVWRVYSDGRAERVAGALSKGYDLEGVGTEVGLNQPTRLLQISDTKVLITDTLNNVIRELDLETGYVRTVYGSVDIETIEIENGVFKGVGFVQDLDFDSNGNLFITSNQTDVPQSDIIRQDANGDWYIWSFDKSALPDRFSIIDAIIDADFTYMLLHDQVNDKKYYVKYTQSGSFVYSVELGIAFGGGLVVDPVSKDHLVGDHTAILKIDPDTGTSSLFDVGRSFANVALLSVEGNILLITDSDAGRVYKYDLIAEEIVANLGAREGSSNTVVRLGSYNGELLALDNQSPRLLKFGEDGVTVEVGTGENARFFASGGKESTLYYPNAFTVDSQGNYYIVESNHRVVKINTDGTAEVFAGSLNYGNTGVGGQAINATFQSIYGLATGANDRIYIVDSYNHQVKYVASDGIVQVLSGTGTLGAGFGLDGGLNTPLDVLETESGRIFVSDSWNNRIVEWDPVNGIQSYAGRTVSTNYQGAGDYGGDGGDAVFAWLNTPGGMAYYEADGTLYFADTFNNRIRYVDSGGKIHTLIGGDQGYEYGETLNLPADVEIIGDTLYVADTGNSLVLKIEDFDRTGDSLTAALSMKDAFANISGNSRSEHVDVDDVDYFDFKDVDGSLRFQVSNSSDSGSFVHVGLFDTNTALISAVSLAPGESVDLGEANFEFLTMQGSDSDYTLSWT